MSVSKWRFSKVDLVALNVEASSLFWRARAGSETARLAGSGLALAKLACETRQNLECY